MSMRTSPTYRWIMIVLAIACVGGAGYLAYRTFFAGSSAAQQLKLAEDTYARGLTAYDQKNWADAATRFDEAKLLATKAGEALEAQVKEGKIPPDEVKSLQGRIMWVKARAIRDQAYARGQADGKPLTDIPDQQYGETYRATGMIPDPEARAEAIAAMRGAADLLRTDPEINKETLRCELILQPMHWGVTETLLRTAIELNPNDARARYYLARFEFDQPIAGTVIPTPGAKKMGDRVDLAREHLAVAKQNGSPPWRTTGLEAEILDWQLRSATTRKLKPDVIAATERTLIELLFDAKSGAIPMAARGEKLSPFGIADAHGMSQILAVAMDRAVIESRRPNGTPDRVWAVVRAALAVATKAADDAALKQHLPEFAAALAVAVAQAQPVLARADPTGWRDLLSGPAGVDAALAKLPDTAKTRPAIHLRLAQVAYFDSLLAGKNGDTARNKELFDRALKQAEEGLKAAEASNAPAAEVEEFHAVLAEWKLLAGVKADAVEPHLARLRGSAVPRHKLIGQFLDAVVAEREGKLDKARKLLQPLANDKDRANHDLATQANAKLAAIYLVTGDPGAALACLRVIEQDAARIEELSPAERAWILDLARGVDDVIALQVVATIEGAIQGVARFRKDNPGKPVPGEMLAPHDAAIAALLKKLRAPSSADRMARLYNATYRALTGRPDEAEARLTELAIDYPDSIDVLRPRMALLAAPKDPAAGRFDPNGLAKADALIHKFLKDYPGDRAAKLFRAEWLVRTDRAEKAIEYLKDPATFPGGRNEAVDRLMAAALFQTGQGDEARKILSRLPADPGIDAALFQAATSHEAAQKQVNDALARYENQGLFRIYDAALRLGEGKYEEAIRGFASAVEFTRVGPTAKAGLQRALIAYAEADPAKARDAAVKLAGEMPDEPGIYLAAATAALLLDEVGSPDDRWEQAKTMYAAVNKWEAVALKAGTARTDTAVLKAQFRLLAGDPAGARKDALSALAQSPNHVPTLLLLTDLSLAPPADLARAREYYDSIVKANSSDPRLPYVDARIKQIAGDWTGAAAVYERLVGEAPRNAGIYVLLIAALEGGGQKEAALRWTRLWHERIPEDTRATVGLIHLLAASGARPEAIKIADEFVAATAAEARKRASNAAPPQTPAEVEKAGEDGRLGALLAVASGFFRAGVYDEAEARAREVVQARPAADRAWMMLGDIAIAKKEWDKAVPIYRDVLQKQPRHFVAGNNLAWILAEKMNDPVAAMLVVEEVRKGPGGVRPIGPERLPADFLDTLGVVYLKLKEKGVDRVAEMRTVFEAASRRYPADPRMLLYLAHAQALAGDRARALETFDAAIHLAATKNGLKEEQNKEVIDAAEAARKKLRS